jgi:hypothetical protein
VHELYLRLVDQRSVEWNDRAHFFAVAAQVMRRILVDHARRRKSDKRGGGMVPVTIGAALDVAVVRELRRRGARRRARGSSRRSSRSRPSSWSSGSTAG